MRWEWIAANPARVAQRPRLKTPEPDPPSAADAARLLDSAFEMDDDLGTLVWLVMTTGIRRGEVCALRWRHVDLDGETIEIRRAYTLHKGVGVEKDTKTHQMRRIALDSETVALLREYRAAFRLDSRISAARPRSDVRVHEREGPRAQQTVLAARVSSRYKYMAERLGFDTHLHALRHYSATELLSAGVDLRTVAGRLGHGGRGATTLRVYAAWVAASDRTGRRRSCSGLACRSGGRRRSRVDPDVSVKFD